MNFKRLTLLSTTLLLCHTAAATPSAPTASAALQAACNAKGASPHALPGITLRSMPAAPGDLPYVMADSAATGSQVRIYHEPKLAAAALSKAACFAGLVDLLAPYIPDKRRGLQWSPIIITTDPGFIPVRTKEEARWLKVFASTEWDDQGLAFLLQVIPHEETHFSQSRSKNKLPRWFEEGHAEWAGQRINAQLRSELALKRRTHYATEAAKLGAANLADWGGLQVKPEAIERQLSAEDRARKAKDPSYSPPGPFNFGPGDLVQDMANEQGRYGAALAIFEGLEQRHGLAAVQAWILAVFDASENSQIVPLARQHFGEDIAPLLK